MFARALLIVIQPLLFLSALVGVYLATGVGLLLYITAIALFIIFTVIGVVMLLRRTSVKCFHLSEGHVHAERGWPWPPLEFELENIRLRHLGARLYKFDYQGLSYTFDKSLCSCMTDERFAELADDLKIRSQ